MGQAAGLQQLPALAAVLLVCMSWRHSVQAAQVHQQQQSTMVKPDPLHASGLNWRDCAPARMVAVQGSDQVSDVIKAAIKEADTAGQQLLVRATRNRYLTHNNFSCPEANPKVLSIALDMSHYKKVLKLSQNTITVQAGITFEELEEELLRHQLSLPGVILSPYMTEMSLGGALMTASHGSSLVGPASIAPYITHAVLVDGTGQVHSLDKPSALLEGSVGLVGIVTELTLQLAAGQKVAVKQLQEEDHEMVGDLREIIERSEAVALDVTWSPSAGMYTARVWHEADMQELGDARNVYMHTSNDWAHAANQRLTQDQHDLHDETGVMCQILGEITGMSHFTKTERSKVSSPEHADGEDGYVPGVTVGWVNRLAGLRCPGGTACLWRHVKWTPHEIAINSEDFSDWLDDVKLVMDQAQGCPGFLFNFRFVMESDAPLAMHSGKQVVTVDMTTIGGLGTNMPIKHHALLEEVLQMSLCKYGARPHWGFSTNRMLLSGCPLRDTLGADWEVFRVKQQQYDPNSIFVPPIWRSIEARSVGTMYPRCAPMGDCFCQENSHCGPRYKCVPGKVFKEYNVCVAEEWLRETAEL